MANGRQPENLKEGLLSGLSQAAPLVTEGIAGYRQAQKEAALTALKMMMQEQQQRAENEMAAQRLMLLRAQIKRADIETDIANIKLGQTADLDFEASQAKKESLAKIEAVIEGIERFQKVDVPPEFQMTRITPEGPTLERKPGEIPAGFEMTRVTQGGATFQKKGLSESDLSARDKLILGNLTKRFGAQEAETRFTERYMEGLSNPVDEFDRIYLANVPSGLDAGDPELEEKAWSISHERSGLLPEYADPGEDKPHYTTVIAGLKAGLEKGNITQETYDYHISRVAALIGKTVEEMEKEISASGLWRH